MQPLAMGLHGHSDMFGVARLDGVLVPEVPANAMVDVTLPVAGLRVGDVVVSNFGWASVDTVLVTSPGRVEVDGQVSISMANPRPGSMAEQTVWALVFWVRTQGYTTPA